MRTFLQAVCFFLLGATFAFAAPDFPELTGRVVDGAHILSDGTRQSLDRMLAEYEKGTTNQVVVVTIPSLKGRSIEEYGYQLGRYWQIGQKSKNNGLLLLVAPAEHKVRIEVGYGLEPVMTDAASSAVVQGIILPAFRAGEQEKGIIDGTQAILSVLGGKGVPVTPPAAYHLQDGVFSIHEVTTENTVSGVQLLILILCAACFIVFCIRYPFFALFMFLGQPSYFGSSRMDSSGWGGGFSGGGGSFGGGGSSGSW